MYVNQTCDRFIFVSFVYTLKSIFILRHTNFVFKGTKYYITVILLRFLFPIDFAHTRPPAIYVNLLYTYLGKWISSLLVCAEKKFLFQWGINVEY